MMLENNLHPDVAERPQDLVVYGGIGKAARDHASLRTIKRELMIFLTPYVAYTAMELEEITQLEKSRLKIMDLRDIEAESDRWLERIRK